MMASTPTEPKTAKSRKNRGGRPSKIDPKVERDIVRLVEEGNFPDVAAQAAGIDRATFYRWMKRGREGDPAYAGFATEIARAEAFAQTELVKVVRRGDEQGKSFGRARARLELLQRRFGRRWSQKIQHELSDQRDFEIAAAVETVRELFGAEGAENFHVKFLERLAAADDQPDDDPMPAEPDAATH